MAPEESSSVPSSRPERRQNSYRVGRWDDQEHKIFLQGLNTHGKNWKKIAELVKTRSPVQTRTHAQKYFLKNAKKAEETSTDNKPIAEPESQKKNAQRKAKRPLPVVEEACYQAKRVKADPLEKITIKESFDSIFENIQDPLTDFLDDVSTPRTVNPFNKIPPTFEGLKTKPLHATTKTKLSYKRSLDMEDPLLSFSMMPPSSKTGSSNTDFRISAPFEIDAFDEHSSLGSSHLSSDDDILLGGGDFDVFFGEEVF